MQLQHGISGSAGLCAGTLGIGKPAVLQGVCPRPASPSSGHGDHRSKTVGAQKRFTVSIYLVSASYLIHQHFHINECDWKPSFCAHFAFWAKMQKSDELARPTRLIRTAWRARSLGGLCSGQCPRCRAQVAKWAFSGFLSGEACAALALSAFFNVVIYHF